MRLAALTLKGSETWSTLHLDPIFPGLNVIYGRPSSGKTTLASFLAHLLYGQYPTKGPSGRSGDPYDLPDGEAIVENGDTQYRLRRSRLGQVARLTVSSLDGSSVDHETVRRMLGGPSPVLFRRLYAINFSQRPLIEGLLSVEFARELRSLRIGKTSESGRRAAELLARRDTLAKELETRLAGEGRASRDLDARRCELERLIADVERDGATIDQQFRSVEAALTETDTRLRYRRLEMNLDRNWQAAAPIDRDERLADLDEQIVRWRAALAELASREATVRARFVHAPSNAGTAAEIVTDERAWLLVARQLAADLTGEVARLARASSSDQCVCRDAHPRMRPLVETIQRQLDVLATLIEEQEQALQATELAAEISHLERSQVELGRQLEQLVDRRHALVSRAALSTRRISREMNGAEVAPRENAGGSGSLGLTSADAEQLERRRHELEEKRLELSNRLMARERRLRDLRAERTAVDRQRASLLSARSIEHVQRELVAVQQKLQEAMQSETTSDIAEFSAQNSPRASDILAKLTDGRLVRLQLVEDGRCVNVWMRDGAVLSLESLSPAERDQVYLSFSLALVAAAERQAIRLPMFLDEPFLRLDAPATAALAAVLDDLGRQGLQIIVFTGQCEAADRLTSLGAPVADIQELRQREREQPTSAAPEPAAATAIRPVAVKKTKSAHRIAKNGRSKSPRDTAPPEVPAPTDRSDAA